MDKNDLKKILAGISLAGLLAGSGLSPSACASDGQGSWSGSKQGAGSTQNEETPVPTPQTPAPSSWSGSKEGAGSTQNEETPVPAPKTPGPGGWSGSK